ncbi:kinase-like protein [Punctularia strigosozonata HHB-11173 SS5]|uniref:Kinase-like protein n=1 Tax=Punctularia strigosozonata (strain HHB-11173) TaxID=741275 RepID=R7S0H9_PUNST|nr:kinase-like protein [Punctularia strigosozonata HHB-11173 SS5]EIN03905.1 kinase-like protein [Punctularia strigosozonata HHB-11173 SS5]
MGYARINHTILRRLSKAVEADPEGDLEGILHNLYTSYPRLRAASDRKAKKLALLEKNIDKLAPSTVTNAPSTTKGLSPPSFLKAVDHDTVEVVVPLEAEVISVLRSEGTPGQPISEAILQLLRSRPPLYACGGACVIPLSDTVVAKFSDEDCRCEIAMLQFLDTHVPTVNAPKFLGLANVGPRACMFMTRLSGETLEKRWPDLCDSQKRQVRDLLDKMLHSLRTFELPAGSPFGSVTEQRICKDTRQSTHRSIPNSITTEQQFNEFISTCNSSRVAPRYRNWISSLLRTNHRILLTHGDLHPANIIVHTDDDARISVGIIDWEMAGYYPEYWEMLKALNTRAVDDRSDWWDWLPPSILGYDIEVVIDRYMEKALGLWCKNGYHLWQFGDAGWIEPQRDSIFHVSFSIAASTAEAWIRLPMPTATLAVAIYRPQENSKSHWALWLSVTTDGVVEDIIYHAAGEPGALALEIRHHNPRQSRRISQIIYVSDLDSERDIQEVRDIMDSQPLLNDIPVWGCQDWVMEALDTMDEEEVLDTTWPEAKEQLMAVFKN